MTTLSKVFEPIQIGNVEIPNRVVRAAHGTMFGADGVSDAFINYHLERARGGVGLTILEASPVHHTTTLFVHLRSDEDRVVEGYQRMMDKIRPHGMRVFQQLWHGGHQYPGHHGQMPLSASSLASVNNGLVPWPMTKSEIDEVIEAFANAAVRCRDGGLDGVELHGAHGYLFMQFLSAQSNWRTDEYGGSLENRLRLLRETLIAVRKATGGDFPVGVRLSASTSHGGLGKDELTAVAKSLDSEGLIDFLNVSYGDYYSMDAIIGGMHRPTGYELPSSAEIAAAVKVPRIIGGRYRTLDDVEQVLREGTADMVSMVRALIADPALVNKTRDGRADEVRPCLGCNQGCSGLSAIGNHMGCTVNIAVGREGDLSEDLITRAKSPKKVLVVGGGPAGMEAARIAALGGHRVVLAEASGDLGGAVNVARRAPNLAALADITVWLEQEIFRLGVEVRLGTYMDDEDIIAENADHVIIATGSLPRDDGRQIVIPSDLPTGVDQRHVINSTELLTNPESALGPRALVLDDVGHYEAIAAAEYLVERGIAVTYVTRFPMMAPEVEKFNRVSPALERLLKGQFDLLTYHALVEIREDACLVRPLQSEDTKTVPANTVVLVTINEPMRELYDSLRTRHPSIRIIGDASAPRDVKFAIADGHLTARALSGVQ